MTQAKKDENELLETIAELEENLAAKEEERILKNINKLDTKPCSPPAQSAKQILLFSYKAWCIVHIFYFNSVTLLSS